MTPFFSRLSYSLGNEDWVTELKALQIEPKHRVVCITASGDRPLHLLLNECQEMVAVDANPAQNHLLQLKQTAMGQLNYADYLAFLGVSNCQSQRRHEWLNQLAPHLPSTTAHYWKEKIKAIKRGVIYEGATERWVRRFSYLLRFVRRREINTLFSFHDLESQREFLQKKWNHTFWKTMLNVGLHPWITSVFFKDPGTYSNFDRSIKPGSYTYGKMIECLHHHLAKENLLVSLIFKGSVSQEAYPPYLKPEGIQSIRKNLPKLTIKTADIIEFLQSQPDHSIDRFSLSDVASYLNFDQYQHLLKEVYRTAKSGARFCLRQFISRHEVPKEMELWFQRDYPLEQSLEKEERAFVYHFTVGTVRK